MRPKPAPIAVDGVTDQGRGPRDRERQGVFLAGFFPPRERAAAQAIASVIAAAAAKKKINIKY